MEYNNNYVKSLKRKLGYLQIKMLSVVDSEWQNNGDVFSFLQFFLFQVYEMHMFYFL